jgi:proline dehydrogenase
LHTTIVGIARRRVDALVSTRRNLTPPTSSGDAVSVLRPLILALSRSKWLERIATHAPLARSFSRRFVAGTARDDAIAAVRRLNADGFGATVSFLGEAVTSPREVDACIDEFTRFIDAVRAYSLRSHLSVKLTELGLAFDPDLAARSLDAVLARASDAGVFVRIDMEDSRYTQATLDLFRHARGSRDNVGIVIQAYLHRSADHIAALAREGASVRLVKGAYREPNDIAFQDKRDVDAAFVRLADNYLSGMADGAWLAVATHDRRMIDAVLRSADRHRIDRDRFEFQFLYGIRPDLHRALRDAGHRVRIYVPYGTHWYPYLMRRLAERPANLWFFVRNAVRG